MGKANGSRECDDRLRVPIIQTDDAERWWARREVRLCPPYSFYFGVEGMAEEWWSTISQRSPFFT